MDGTSAALLASRANALPDALTAELACDRRIEFSPDVARGRWVTTGVGVSEDPARFLAFVLHDTLGLDAQFVPLSAFLLERPRGACLVVFSQGLSPNSMLATEQSTAFQRTLVVTAVAPDVAEHPRSDCATRLRRSGLDVVVHGPADESQLLLRVVGPAVARLCAVRVADAAAAALGHREPFGETLRRSIPTAVGAATSRARELVTRLPARVLFHRLAWLTFGTAGELAHGMRWKWLEGMGVDSSVWDAMQLAHGPFQSFYDSTATLVTLEPAAHELVPAVVDRIEAMLDRSRHSLVRLSSSLPGSLCVFEHDAQCTQLVLHGLQVQPRDLRHWPGKGRDKPIYDIASTSGVTALPAGKRA